MMINALRKNEVTLSLRNTASQLEAALEQAEKAHQAKNDILAKMKHEIRVPLGTILGLTVQALEVGKLNDEPRIPIEKVHIEKVYDAGTSILNMVNEILNTLPSDSSVSSNDTKTKGERT